MKWLRIAFVFIMVAIVLISGARMLDTGFAAAPDEPAGPPNPLSLDKANLIDPGAGSSGPQIQTDLENSPKQLAPGGDLPCGGVYFSTAETFVRQNLPNTNFDEAELRVSQGSPSNGSERVFMKFDLTDAVPAGASIQRAELELNLFQDPQPITYTLQVFSHQHPDWSEEELTWSTQPALTLDFAPATYAITHTQAVSSVVRLDVTTWATLWATGAITHTGLTVAPAGSAAMAVSFHSSETERGYYWPRLKITCSAKKIAIPLNSLIGDLKQMEGFTRLDRESTVTTTIRLERGSLAFAEFEIPVPATVTHTGVERARWFTRVYSDVLRVDDPANELQLVRRSPDDQHIFFRQLHYGIPVFPSEMAVHLDGAQVSGVSGKTLPEVTTDPTPSLTSEQAETIALKLAGPNVALNGDTQLSYLNLGLIGAPDDNTYLAWRVNLSNGMAAFIDAHNGTRLHEQFDYKEGWDLDLNTANGTGPSKTYCNFHHYPWSASNLGNGSGLFPEALFDPEANPAWNAIAAAWVFWNNLGAHSYDWDGAEVEMYIHVGWFPGIAAWSGDCDYFLFTDGAAQARDIVGHEFTHAVMDHGGMPHFENSWWPGALEESFADIFGNFAEAKFDWFAGEDDPNWLTKRSMFNPARDMMSKTDCPNGNDPVNGDKGCIHSNCGVHNKAAYHLTEGGWFNGYDMQNGIGREKALRLFYSMMYRLGSNADFMQARYAAVSVAMDFQKTDQHNFTKHDVCVVMRAYASVGLGNGDYNCDGVEDTIGPDTDHDHTLDFWDNCDDVQNPSQTDTDEDGMGDACDPNTDDDDFPEHTYPFTCKGGNMVACNDNCPLSFQLDQADWNSNAVGDICDDADGDGVSDATDNCITTPNADQLKSDLDALGDACDTDDDDDTVLDIWDNCPTTPNKDQIDKDFITSSMYISDGIGDACDLCPHMNNSSDNSDPDHDYMANPCDADNDNDGVLDDGDHNLIEGFHPCTANQTQNCDDNCSIIKNEYQTDFNANGVGSACEEGDQPNFGFNDKSSTFDFQPGKAFEIGLPGGGGEHPDWGHDYLGFGYKEIISLETNVDVFLQIVDSSGEVMAKSKLSGTSLKNQTLQFIPAPSFVQPEIDSLRFQAQPSNILDHSAVRYYLQLIPAESTPPTTPITFTLQIDGGVPIQVYLPVVRK